MCLAETVWILINTFQFQSDFCVNTHFYLLFLLFLCVFLCSKMSVTQHSFACSLARSFDCFNRFCYFVAAVIVSYREVWQYTLSRRRGRNIHTYRTIVFITSPSIHTNGVFICLTSTLFTFFLDGETLSPWPRALCLFPLAESPFVVLVAHTHMGVQRIRRGNIYALFAFVLIVVFIFLVS